jgi:hypothetical protein
MNESLSLKKQVPKNYAKLFVQNITDAKNFCKENKVKTQEIWMKLFLFTQSKYFKILNTHC